MKLRVIDYLVNPGGGVRFVTECLRALTHNHRRLRLELVTHGQALNTYRALLRREGLDVPVIDLAPGGYWKTKPGTRMLGIPGTGRLKRWAGFDSQWLFDVQPAAIKDCDVVWFPWMHRHALPEGPAEHVVASFHDAIMFQWRGLIATANLASESVSVRRWLSSRARIVVSADATRRVIADHFNVSPERFTIIPVAWDHAQRRACVRELPWSWTRQRFLLCPANTSPHKNHEVLFEAYAAWGAPMPLVLTGYGTDLPPGDPRAEQLRRVLATRRIEIGPMVVGLGYVEDPIYYTLLDRGWALVMPSLLEGGGSFPVMEAMVRGIPVVCSDIPVLREQIERTGGNVLWFDPRDPEALRQRLDELERSNARFRARAAAQVTHLRRRTWLDVASDYLRVFADAATVSLR